eukprot:CAMPEP_0114231874 /NCGR_PEP_ID=MMETSP0058-20121206/4294_1 /TAXON_ID=36894 /ORGANISM="Pyramimonas parkeae, CCMP726" /LENGTH=99 /DNA_ID=CAMNT_0001343287 /DNA_START=213 /DNA_END=508 /DNA_ORIENTATION=+
MGSYKFMDLGLNLLPRKEIRIRMNQVVRLKILQHVIHTLVPYSLKKGRYAWVGALQGHAYVTAEEIALIESLDIKFYLVMHGVGEAGKVRGTRLAYSFA